MQETTKDINAKLLEFQSKIETIKKDGKNTFFKKPDGKASTYATLPNILSEVKPLLTELMLVVTQPLKDGKVFTVITDSETGKSIESFLELPQGLNAQQTGSAVTYFRRYTLSSLLSLEIDEDDDGNKASAPTKPIEVKAVAKTPTLTKLQNAFKMIDETKNMTELNELVDKLSKSTKLTEDEKEQIYAVSAEAEDRFLTELTA